MVTLQELKGATVAHTDAGDFLQIEGELHTEFTLTGTIKKARAGLFFIDIEGESFTAHKQGGFSVGEEVICILKFHMQNDEKILQVRSLEKL